MTLPSLQTPIRIPFGVTNRESRLGCITGHNNCLECIDLEMGTVQASSQDALRPLLLDGHRLLAGMAASNASKQIDLRLLTVHSGHFELMWKTMIDLPVWAADPQTWRSHPGPGQLELSATLEAEVFILHWRGTAPAAKGIIPQKGDDTPATGGTIGVRADNGNVVDAEAQTPHQPADAAEMPQSELLGVYRVGSETQAMQRIPWQVDGTMHILVKQDHNAQQGLVLRELTSSSQETMREIRLLDDPYVIPILSPDGRYLFIPSTEQTQGQTWIIIETKTGRTVSRHPIALDAEELAVVGSRILYAARRDLLPAGAERRRTLVACDLESGNVLWSRSFDEEVMFAMPTSIMRR